MAQANKILTVELNKTLLLKCLKVLLPLTNKNIFSIDKGCWIFLGNFSNSSKMLNYFSNWLFTVQVFVTTQVLIVIFRRIKKNKTRLNQGLRKAAHLDFLD